MPSAVEIAAGDIPLTNGAMITSPDKADKPSIAVVGLAGRFPGEATDANALWDLCCEGRSAWSEIPEDRFSIQAYRHSNPSKIGCFNPKGAHFLKDDVGLFDAGFFGISPVEAKAMDPQQRLLLETTYEAMENAGITLEKMAAGNTGVYVGACQVDYASLLQADIQDLPVYSITGTSSNSLSNRISYIFNLKGPSFTVDTACSSSLAALHTACQSLQLGETDHAVVGGAHIVLSPGTMVGMSMLRLFGEDGRSYSFDARGTGYGRGEGVVSIILKRLDDAVRDGDNIRAVIRNTGMNQDGKTPGMTFPSCEAQARLIKSVYDTAGLDPLETDYVEAHGTGTAAGDPIEAEAIALSLSKMRPRDSPLIVGSVKSNIGHLEAVSGLAAMVKTILAFERNSIPPNFDFQTPNKDIPLEDWNIKIPTTVMSWPNPSIQRASISNFGFGGTNVHIILEKYKKSTPSLSYQESERPYLNGNIAPIRFPSETLENGFHDKDSNTFIERLKTQAAQHLSPNLQPPRRLLFVLSANDRASLKNRGMKLSTYLEDHRNIDLDSLAYTLNQRRSTLEWREAVAATTSSELSQILSNDSTECAKSSERPRLGFVFTGQGAQWASMGLELLAYRIFAQTLGQAESILKSFGAKWSLLDELTKDSESSQISQPFLSQPITTAIQIALADLLSTWNIKPDAVVGHSSGEIAAAYAAGALSLQDAMLIAYHRGVLAGSLKETRPDRPGSMIAIGASQSHVRPMLKRVGSAHAVVACVNAPSLVTVSGDERAIARIQALAEEENLLNRRLKVDVAYHSPHMEDVARQYLESISGIVPQTSTNVKFHSSVKGCLIDTSNLTAEYWVENMTSPVQFLDGVQSMSEKVQGPDLLIEIGPHSTLKAPLMDIMKAHPSRPSKVRYLSALVRNKDAITTTLSLAASLYVMGAGVDVSAVNQVGKVKPPKILSDLPAYPWNHGKRHWHESRLSVNHRHKKFPRSDLLGHLADDLNMEELRWRNILRLTEMPWLADHAVQGSILFPFAGYVVMALEAAFQHAMLHSLPVTGKTSYRLREVQVSRSMVLSEATPTEISFVLRARDEGTRSPSTSWQKFVVYSWTPDNGWVEHCQGLIRSTQDAESNPVCGSRDVDFQNKQYSDMISSHQSLCQKTMDCTTIYDRFSSGGLQFGPAFRNITAARRTLDKSIGTVIVPDTAKDMPNGEENVFCIHPRTLDASFQLPDLANDEAHLSSSNIYLPVFVKEIMIKHRLRHEPGQELTVYAQKHRPYVNNEAESHASLIVTSSDNPSDVLIDFQDCVGSIFPKTSNDQLDDRNLCYRIDWSPCTDLMSPDQFTSAFSMSDIDPRPQLEKMERGALYYMQRLLRNLPPEDVEDSPPHFQNLYAVITSLFAKSQHGELSYPTKEWLESNDDEQEAFLTDLANMDACGHLLCDIGKNLLHIIEEDIEPLSIMKHNDKLEQYYRNMDVMRRGNEIAAAVISNLADQNPSMRILEIGAGSGNATKSILQALGSRFASYHLTDVSANHFDNAKETCRDWSDKMKYTILDIERDPLAQGFDLGSYDLIVASATLHSTANTAVTMKNLRSLLQPSGKTVFSEPTATLLSDTVIFGTLPDWWRSEEPERQEGPCLTEVQWDAQLKQSGFSGINNSIKIIPGGPDSTSIILSTANSERPPVYPHVALLACGDIEHQLLQTVNDQLQTTTNQPKTPIGPLLEVPLDDRYGIVLALDRAFWSDLTEEGFKQLQNVFATGRGLLWVTRGARAANPETNMVTGLARALRGENPGFRFITLDLDDHQHSSEFQISDTIVKVFKHTFELENDARFIDEMEFAELDGMLQVPRALSDPKKDQYIVRETCVPVPEPQNFHQPGRPLKLKVGQIGLLDSIHFVDDQEASLPLKSNQVEIAVAAVGMNFIDIMMSLGRIPPSRHPGQECSGTVTAVGEGVQNLAVGDRVCALAPGSYGNLVRTSQYWAVKIPQDMSFHHAASIPVIFGTAHYGLMDIARLSQGESVLIHAAAGGVGQAAILLAQRAEADLFVTVGSSDKKKLMMEEYGIPEERIFSSRDTSFQKELVAMTGNRGVDIVLNSTSGDILHQSWQCLAPLGRFIEIGKRDFVQNSNLEMNKFLESVTFAGVDLGVFALNRPQSFQQILSEMVDLHARGILKSIKPLNVFPISKLQQAMRTMQNGKHIGKIIIDCTGNDIVQALPAPSPKAVSGTDSSYLITGGTGGIGRSITRWLAHEGAKNIILASRSGPDQKGVPELIKELQELDVNVYVDRCDVADLAQVKSLISKCQATMPPIRGIIHGAMALRDALFENLSYSDWISNTKPRIQGAWNLHNASLDSGLELDFFLMLGSVSGIVGVPGQSAYDASNTFLDSFAAYRNNLGLPASTIDIGFVDTVGWAAENKHKVPGMAAAAHDSLSEKELLAVIKAAITGGEEYRQTVTGLKIKQGKSIPVWAADPKFVHVLHEHRASTSSSTPTDSSATSSNSTRQLLRDAPSLDVATKIITEALCQRLSTLLLISAGEVDVTKPVIAYGLDSLAAVELRNWITSGLEANVPLMELMNSPSIGALAGRIVGGSRLFSGKREDSGDGGSGEKAEETQ